MKARPDASHVRALTIASLLVLWMLAIGVRLVYLQTFRHDWLTVRAREQQEGAVEISSLRGLVLDRSGRELARSVDVESFFIVPGEIQEVDEVASRLAPLIGADGRALATKIRDAQGANRKFLWVARKVDHEQAERINALDIEGVYSRKEPKRFYPNGALAAHVLGFVGLDETGLGGIEQSFNERISGEAGRFFFETDARHRAYTSTEVGGRTGQTVVLTIDQMVQYRTEQALADAVERAHAKSGTAIVLDPRTGEILALANAPTFDPNDARSVQPQVRANQALQNVYEPGSTFKIVAYSAAIEEGLAKPTDRIDCQMGSITVAGRLVHDHHPFGTLTLIDALAKSSNVAAIKLGLRVGDERMHDYITRFGFGSRTGVELPGETAGLVRPVARWQPSSMGSIAIGQEVGVTPLQVAAAFGTIANDGMRIAPHLVREIRAPDGAVAFTAQPEQHRVVSAETARTLRGMLESVTLNGTAKLAQLNGYSAAGKTGTAQKIDPRTHTYSTTKYIGSFVGFAPAENPAVVIIVVIDEPVGSYHGGDVAAPVFREIAEQILPDLNVSPDTQIRQSAGGDLIAQSPHAAEESERVREQLERERQAQQATLPQAADANHGSGLSEVVYAPATRNAVLMPDVRGRSVRDVARICAQLGLQLETEGEGRAQRQQPAPGTEIEVGQVVHIHFRRKE
ncbi:MAG TPA: penicillin-binding protein [Pyrinomonadaceae bacterium]|nr:penicillin-binding protein [Pyrinomonadaceae bacterium]